MSTTQHTAHYNLPTFGDNPNDRPSWRGDFTDAMTKIDNQMYANATNITTAQNTANDAKTTAQAAQTTANAANDTAEEARSAADSNTTAISDLKKVVDSLNPTTKKMVWFGDSWSTNGNIPNAVARNIGNPTVYNFAEGGAGFSQTSSFIEQINAASASDDFDNSEIDYAVIFGGINDNDATNYNTTIALLSSTFPNAKKYFIGPQCGWSSNNYKKYITQCIVAERNPTADVIVVTNIQYWEAGFQEDFTNTQPCHPNGSGETVFANKISAILNGYSPQGNSAKISGTLNTTTCSQGQITVMMYGDGLAFVEGWFQPKQSGTIDVATFPADGVKVLPRCFSNMHIPVDIYSSPAATERNVGCFAIFSQDSSADDIEASPAGWLGKPLKLTLHGAMANTQHYIPWQLVTLKTTING